MDLLVITTPDAMHYKLMHSDIFDTIVILARITDGQARRRISKKNCPSEARTHDLPMSFPPMWDNSRTL